MCGVEYVSVSINRLLFLLLVFSAHTIFIPSELSLTLNYSTEALVKAHICLAVKQFVRAVGVIYLYPRNAGFPSSGFFQIHSKQLAGECLHFVYKICLAHGGYRVRVWRGFKL